MESQCIDAGQGTCMVGLGMAGCSPGIKELFPSCSFYIKNRSL